jgi:hypothetical protein
MRRVIVESPYAGAIRMNVAYARAAVRDCLERGEAPIASHLLYTQEGVLRDDVPAERQWGIDAGLAWGVVADATVVYTDFGISSGMSYGIANARKADRHVEYRKLISFQSTEKGTAMRNKSTMRDVFNVIEGERAYQDAGTGNAARHEEKAMSVGEFILCMEEYCAKERAAWCKAGGVTPSLHEIRKVTALGVHCMELHGAVPRV